MKNILKIMKSIFKTIKEIFYLIFILGVLLVGNYFVTYKMSLYEIYRYYFKFKDNKATVLRHREEWGQEMKRKSVTHYYYIKYNIPGNLLTQYRWVIINTKRPKEGEIINFKYNPDNPEEMKFTILGEYLLFFIICIPLNIVGIFFLKRVIKYFYLNLMRKFRKKIV